MKCRKCGSVIEDGVAFCQECGSAVPSPVKSVEAKESFVEKMEKSFYFKIARGFTWLILFLTVIYLVIISVNFIPSIFNLYGGSTSVSQEEIQQALNAEKASAQYVLNENHNEKLDPKLMAKLDQAIYEIVVLFSQDFQRTGGGIEGLRNSIKNNLYQWDRIETKIAVAQDAKAAISNFPEKERPNAFMQFIKIKANKESARQAKKAKAIVELAALPMTLFCIAAIITLVSMILVLLAIERNTREHTRVEK